MTKTAFKLKSQGSSFKMMGATPGESPAKLGGLYKLLKLGYRAITGTRKIKKSGKIKTTSDYIGKTKTSSRTKQVIDNAEDLATAHNKTVRQIPIRYTGLDAAIDYGTYKAGEAYYDAKEGIITNPLNEIEVTGDTSTVVQQYNKKKTKNELDSNKINIQD
tara:strand:+ start:66 stop:548 length:483 start_codon:yes stop_codon:yes gene_type:complete